MIILEISKSLQSQQVFRLLKQFLISFQRT